MSTVTLTSVHSTTRRRRALSLAVIATYTSPLFNLPPEIIIDIIGLAILEVKPSAIAVISKAINNYVNCVLYRTVVLETPQRLHLFHRTAIAKSDVFLAAHVKSLAVTWTPEHLHSRERRLLDDIVHACPGLRTLSVPSFYWQISQSPYSRVAGCEGPSHITLESFSDVDDTIDPLSILHLPPRLQSFAKISACLTHLRFCEPSDSWHSPSAILESFGSLPHLTHLQLSRRANANEDNDIIFVNDIATMLSTRRSLKMLVISIFAQSWQGPESVLTSSIWDMLDPFADDQRILRVVGRYGSCKKEWMNSSFQPHAPGAFWISAQVEAAKIAAMTGDGSGGIVNEVSS